MSLITVLFLWGLISDKESYNGKEHSRVNKNEKKVREKKNKSKIEDSWNFLNRLSDLANKLHA